MAIERIWQGGFESGKIEADNLLGSIIAGTGSSYTGDWSARVQSDTQNSHFVVDVDGINQLRAGFYFRPVPNDGQPTICSIHTGTVDAGNKVFSFDAKTGGEITLNIFGVEQDQNNFGWEDGVWVHYGIDIKFDPSAGWVVIYKGGSQILSYVGNTGQLNTDNINFGTFSGLIANSWDGHVYYDDVYVDDTTGEGGATAPRIKRFYFVKPNANGNYSQWMGSDGNQVDNYLLVQEQPADDDTTYVEATTGTLIDSYGMTTFTLDANEDIIAMIPFAIAKRANVTEQIAMGTRSSGTDSVGSDQDLNTSYGYVWERQVTGSLGAPWNQSYMDSVEVMIRSAGTY